MISSKDARTASTGVFLSRLAADAAADQHGTGSGPGTTGPSGTSALASSAFANEIKHLQQKIIDELKTGVDPITVSSGPASQQLALFNSLAQKQLGGSSAMSDPISGRASAIGGLLRPSSVTAYGGLAPGKGLSGTTFNRNRNFYGIDGIPDEGGMFGPSGPFENRAGMFRNGRNCETRLGSLERYVDRSKMLSYGSLPFKSYEYESLNPVRYGDNGYRLMRPLSSASFMGGLTGAEHDFLRESSIPNYMNNGALSSDAEMYLRSGGSLVSLFYIFQSLTYFPLFLASIREGPAT